MSRTANNTRPTIGQHITLTTIVNDEDRQFGFARTDDGVSVYVPARMVKIYDMQREDGEAGAGATCELVENPRFADDPDTSPFMACPPMVWDDDDLFDRIDAIIDELKKIRESI